MVTWLAQLDMEHCYLPTVVVPIYLLTFLRAFELLGWQELGQATGADSVAWIRSYKLLFLFYGCGTSNINQGRTTGPIVKWFFRPVVLNLCYSGVLELQLPETPASRADGEGFWELQSKNI